MKQSIDPKVAFLVVGALVVVIGVTVAWIWTRPTATPEDGGATAASASSKTNQRMDPRMEHGGPTPEQMKEIQEWKKAHPGATTRY